MSIFLGYKNLSKIKTTSVTAVGFLMMRNYKKQNIYFQCSAQSLCFICQDKTLKNSNRNDAKSAGQLFPLHPLSLRCCCYRYCIVGAISRYSVAFILPNKMMLVTFPLHTYILLLSVYAAGRLHYTLYSPTTAQPGPLSWRQRRHSPCYK